MYQMGATGFGVTGWANSSVLESVSTSGSLVLSAFNNNILFQTNGRTERMRITSAGNVGIGTTSPSSQLTLYKGAGNSLLQLINANESDFSLKFHNSGSVGSGTKTFTQFLDYSGSMNGYIAFHRGGGATDGYLSFGDNGGERVRFANGGNVGIGTTSPNSKLDVNGNTIVTGSLNVTAGITGSLFGTSSWAVSASWAPGGSAPTAVTFNRVTGSYTFVLADAGKTIEVSASAAGTYTLTVPSSSVANFANGTYMDVILYGTGSLQFTTGSTNVNIRSANNWLKMGTRYGAATLIKISGEEWYLVGNINA